MNIGQPRAPLIIPQDVPQAIRQELRDANAGNQSIAFVNVIAPPVPAGTEPSTAAPPDQHHRDVINGWCDTIESIETYVGGGALSLVVSPPIAALVVGLLRMGTEETRRALLKDPVTERWTLAMLIAEPAAARPLA